jgi:hypothetical protein
MRYSYLVYFSLISSSGFWAMVRAGAANRRIAAIQVERMVDLRGKREELAA